MEIAVTCRNLKKSFGEKKSLVEALRGVNMEIKTGELTMIVGPSGCGKTTLLSVISGIFLQDSGDCFVFGENINAMSDEEKTIFRKQNIGFIFQAYHLIPSFTALENISIPLLLNGIEEKKATQMAQEMLVRVGLEDRMHALPPHMSGGEQQRVAICRGCVHSPRLIVCDEPTSTLDHKTGMNVLKIFQDIVIDEKKALIVVTHDFRIYEFADRILEMDDGRIIGKRISQEL